MEQAFNTKLIIYRPLVLAIHCCHWFRQYGLLLVVALGMYSCQSSVNQEVHTKESPQTLADSLYLLAKEFRDAQSDDSAYRYYHRSQLLYKEEKDSVMVGKSLVNLAVLMAKKGNYPRSEQYSVEAFYFLDSNLIENRTSLAGNYNNLGIVLHEYKNYDKSTAYYRQAMRYADNVQNQLTYLNNIGNNFRYKGMLDSALQYYDRVLQSSGLSEGNRARTLSNEAITRWQQNPAFDPRNDLFYALQVRQEIKDVEGELATLTHLVDYYKKNQADSALHYALIGYELASNNSFPKEELEFLNFIRKNPIYFKSAWLEKRAIHLHDSLTLVREVQESSLSFYEAEQTNLQNHFLHAKNQLQNLKLERQRNLIWVLGGLILASLIVYSIWQKRTRRINRLEMQQKLQDQRLKTSKKVHDVVANGLYRLMSEIENQEHLNQEDLLDRIEILYNQSRDISYEHENVLVESLQAADQIAKLVQSFATQEVRVILVGNEESWWEGMDQAVYFELEQILQEWMVNMRKHSGADQVVLRFEKGLEGQKITYRDNGIGLPSDFRKGNGWKNTENRILSIGGVLTFEQDLGKGLVMQLLMPNSLKP
jgi:signal transduction histidine kinase